MSKPRWMFDRFKTEAAGLKFADRLDVAMGIYASIRSRVNALTIDDAAALARLRAMLDDLHLEIPKFKAWCVVKHYHGHIPGGSWEPRVWTAHTTKEQAAAFAPAIEKHYIDDRVGHGWTRAEVVQCADRFKVEHRIARVSDLIDPKLTADEYVKGLLR